MYSIEQIFHNYCRWLNMILHDLQYNWVLRGRLRVINVKRMCFLFTCARVVQPNIKPNRAIRLSLSSICWTCIRSVFSIFLMFISQDSIPWLLIGDGNKYSEIKEPASLMCVVFTIRRERISKDGNESASTDNCSSMDDN